MKTLETNPNGSPHLNSLMLRTWYQISTSHIPPSLVLFYCPEHAVAFVLCLHAFLMGIFLHLISLVYSVCLFSLTLSFRTPFRVSSQNFQTSFHLILTFLTHTFNSQEINKKNSIKRKNKTSILTGGGWRSPLLSSAILRPLHIISVLLLPTLSFQALSSLHRSPNSLQLGHISLLALHQVLERLPDSSVLLYKFPECLFNGT